MLKSPHPEDGENRKPPVPTDRSDVETRQYVMHESFNFPTKASYYGATTLAREKTTGQTRPRRSVYSILYLYSAAEPSEAVAPAVLHLVHPTQRRNALNKTESSPLGPFWPRWGEQAVALETAWDITFRRPERRTRRFRVGISRRPGDEL